MKNLALLLGVFTLGSTVIIHGSNDGIVIHGVASAEAKAHKKAAKAAPAVPAPVVEKEVVAAPVDAGVALTADAGPAMVDAGPAVENAGQDAGFDAGLTVVEVATLTTAPPPEIVADAGFGAPVPVSSEGCGGGAGGALIGVLVLVAAGVLLYRFVKPVQAEVNTVVSDVKTDVLNLEAAVKARAAKLEAAAKAIEAKDVATAKSLIAAVEAELTKLGAAAKAEEQAALAKVKALLPV